MTLTRTFTTTFDDTMKKRGFKRKNRLYYKMVGEILQGAVIKAVNPFQITFRPIPYWIPIFIGDSYPLYTGYWAEDVGFTIYSDYYFRKTDEEYSTFYMNKCLEIAEEYILPHFEAITDIDSYLAATHDFWPGRTEEENKYRLIKIPVEKKDIWMTGKTPVFWRVFSSETQYALLYKAFLDNSFEKAHEVLKFQSKFFDGSGYSHPFNTKLFFEKMEQGDYTWIDNFRKERCALMEKRLRDELGICLF